MTAYKNLALVYDDVMGDRQDVAKYVKKLLKTYHPKARSLLELGCGTGSLLIYLSKYYKSVGIDLSPEMLVEAKRKLPKLEFLCEDICKFELDQKFDAIICVFDTINHVTSIKKWEMIFSRVARNLSQDGIFIFDINTVKRINRYAEELPYALEGKNSTCIINVTELKGCNYSLDITAFSRIKNNDYKRLEFQIPEITFEKEVILPILKKYFKKITLKDPDREIVSSQTEELYFVCGRPVESD